MHSRGLNKTLRLILLGLLSFFIPFLIMTLIYYSCGMAPWGEKSVLIMDMSDQYVAFFSELRSIAEGESSIFFSWHKSFGCNFTGVYAYYLASPFSFITLLFPQDELPTALMWLTCIKVGLAGLSFAVFLKTAIGKRDWAILLFSCCYALMSYSVVYSLSIMWLDGLIFLPIIMLGAERLINKNLDKSKAPGKSSPGAEASVLVAGGSVQSAEASSQSAGASIQNAEANVLGGGESVSSVPFSAAEGTESPEQGTPGRLGARLKGFILSFPWLLSVSLAVMFIANYYIAYMVGIFTAIYFMFRFFSQKRPGEFFRYFWRFCAGAALAAGLAAWLLLPTAADLVSGRLADQNPSPNSGTYFGIIELLKKFFPQRYDSITNNGLPSIYCGIFSLLGAGVFFLAKKISLKEKILALGIIGFMLASFISKGLNYIWHGFSYPNWFPFRNAFLLPAFLIYIAYRGICALPAPSFLCAGRPLNKPAPVKRARAEARIICLRAGAGALAGIIIAVQACGLYLNGKAMIQGLDKQFGYKSLASYEQFNEQLGPLVELAKEEEGFFRIEKTFERSKNDAMTLGYNGITHYSSAYNGKINSFTRSLGFAQTHFWNAYYGSTPITDSLFSVRFIMSKREMPEIYSQTAQSGEAVLYENPFALPVGFMAQRAESRGTGFEAQSSMLASLSGLEEEYFTPCSISGAQGEYTITPQTSGPCYMLIENAPYIGGQIYLDGQYKGDYFTSETCCILYLGELEAGQSSILSVRASSKDYAQPQVCTLNTQSLLKALEILAQGGLEIEAYGANYIKGSVDAQQDGMFFSSIPYDKGFSVLIDGKRAESFAGFDTFLCFEVPEGRHEIELIYTAPGQTAGGIICLVSLAFCLGGAGIYIFIIKKKKN